LVSVAVLGLRKKLRRTKMAKRHGGAQVAKVLREEGVQHIFTLCGGHIAPIYLACAEAGIRVIDTRHEQAAAHAADGMARVTRRLGVAVVTAGPGLTDAVTGIANARYADSPVLILAGSAPVAEWDRGALQEMPQLDVVKPITKWARVVTDPRRIGEYTAEAVRAALSGKPGPVYLELPIDVLMEQTDPEEWTLHPGYRTAARVAPAPVHVEAAARLMAQARQPVVIAGSNVWWDRAETALLDFIDKAGWPVYLNGMARGTIPTTHPLFFQHSRRFAFEHADCVVVIGTPLDFRLGYGKFNRETKVIMVDRDSENMGKNRPVDVGVVGHIDLVLPSLTAALADSALDPGWVRQLRDEEKKRAERIRKLASSDAVPINHYRLCRAIAEVAGDDAILVGDGGDIVAVGAKVIPVNRPGHWMDPGPFGCLGVGPSFAMAAKLVHPDKPVIILHGDGSFGLNAMEFDTAVRHNIPILSVIGNDAGWGQIRNPQVALLGERASLATDLALTRYDRVVEALGGYGAFVEKPEDLLPALETALASGKPACVNVALDPTTLRGEVNVMRGLSI
jgi:acetolactate synthase-1/2/3 large subunit